MMDIHAFDSLQPDVFSHPIWAIFQPNTSPPSKQLLTQFSQICAQLLSDNSINDACSVLFISAALEKSRGEYAAAIDHLETAWKISAENQLPLEAIWSAWGTAVMHYLSGDREASANILDWLAARLDEVDQWVLTNIITLLRTNLTASVNSEGFSPNPRELFDNWGRPAASNTAFENLPIKKPHIQLTEPQSMWALLRRIITGDIHLLFVENRAKSNSVERPDQIGNAAPIWTRQQIKISSTQLKGTLTPPTNGHGNKTKEIEPTGKSMEIYCFGPFQIFLNDQAIDDWSSHKAQSILKYLASHYKSPISKEILMDIYWPDADPESARRNLHQTIYILRRQMHEFDPGFQHIQFENDFYRLNPEMEVWIDVQEFDQRVCAGQKFEIAGDHGKAFAEYRLAEGLFRDDFLIDEPYEDWCLQLRREYNQNYINLSLKLAEDYLHKQEFTASSALCQRVLSMEPCQEEAHQILMRSYAEQGLRHRAVDQYHHCAQALKSEFDLPPSEMTNLLYHQIKHI